MKQIFIENFEGFDNLPNYAILGLVNQQLGNKANAKEIVSVSFLEMYYDAITNKVHDYNGYLITYLESDMIASKDDLESAFEAGVNYACEPIKAVLGTGTFKKPVSFEQWFEENFTDNDKN